MKHSIICFILLLPCWLLGQESRPAYCEELPVAYSEIPNANASLPKFATTPTKEYKVQVAILRFTDPSNYPFHPLLIARYRPCEQVWVIESRESYPDRSAAEALREKLRKLGYEGAYLIELVGYQ